MIDGVQIKRGRGLLGWTPKQLAKAAGVRVETVERAERFTGDLPLTVAQAAAIRIALETGGVEFTDSLSEARLKPRTDASSCR